MKLFKTLLILLIVTFFKQQPTLLGQATHWLLGQAARQAWSMFLYFH